MAEKGFLKPTLFPRGTKQLAVLEAGRRVGTAENAQALANQFKVDGEVRSDDQLHVVADARRLLVLYRETGAFWYADFARLHSSDYAPKLPSEDEAKKIATEFLKKNEWLPKTYALDSVHKADGEIIEGQEERKRKTSANHICVDFRAVVGEHHSYGPGAKVKVFLGDKGEVIGLYHAAPDWHRYAEYPVLSKEEVETTLRQKLGCELRGLKIIEAKLIYHAESSVLGRRFVQPTCLFRLESQAKSLRSRKAVPVHFELHPIPATSFAPRVAIETDKAELRITRGEDLALRCRISGGTEPYCIRWESDIDGELGTGSGLETKDLSIAHREGRITAHTLTVTVSDHNGMTDSQSILVTVMPSDGSGQLPKPAAQDDEDPYVGVEWCNIYNTPGLPNISGTNNSAKGFKDAIRALPGWSSRFDWGNAAAWEQDFKFASAPGGGTDAFWADNVHFAFFAGHGSSGRFWFGSTVDDHEMRAQDARWGDGSLNWIVLHACETMRANFEWDVWCDAFEGLHQMFGFHTTTEGSTPPLGSRFGFWASFRFLPWADALPLRSAWQIACMECFDASQQYAMIYAGQSGTDTPNDHLTGFGYVSPDPNAPYYWVYSRGTC